VSPERLKLESRVRADCVHFMVHSMQPLPNNFGPLLLVVAGVHSFSCADDLLVLCTLLVK